MTIEERKEKYITCGGVCCMFCGSEDLDTDRIKSDIGIAWQEVTCLDCGASWKDQYDLVGVDNIEEPEKGDN